MDAAESLPPMSNALLDREQLEQLFRDLKCCASVNELLVKGGSLPAASTEPAASTVGPATLDDLQQRLLAGQLRAVQIRYRYEAAAWCDTILALPGGFRLVRIRQVTEAEIATG